MTTHGTPERIIIRTPNWLGDLMMSTAFIRAVLGAWPRASVHLVVRKGFEGLPLPHRGEVLPFDKSASGAGAFGASLRRLSPTHFFVLPPSLSSAWMAFRSGAPARIGYRGEWRAPLLRPALRHPHGPRQTHIVREYLHLLTALGVPAPEETADDPAGLEITPEFLATHTPPGLPPRKGYVVLAPGAEYGPAKMWPLRHYRALAQGLHGQGHVVVVAGLPQDHGPGQEIIAGLPGALNMAGQTNLNGLVALLDGAALLVSNDSGAMHVGAALGLPQLALFGSTNPTWTAPRNPRARLLSRNEPCAPCYKRTCPLGHTRCLEELAPDEALTAAMEMLGA